MFVGGNGEAGYKQNTRLGGDGTERTQNGIEATGFIRVGYNDTLYFKGVTITSETYEVIAFYNTSYQLVAIAYCSAVHLSSNGEVISQKVSEIALDAITTNKDSIAFFRISAKEINAGSIITVDQSIV